MLTAAVIPARNEAANIVSLLTRLQHCGIKLLIPVINGTDDQTAELLQDKFAACCTAPEAAAGVIRGLRRQLPCKQHSGETTILPLYFADPLGVDVPRAIGAAVAARSGAEAVLFIDGDISGLKESHINSLLRPVVQHSLDVALLDCYPYKFNFLNLPQCAARVLFFRQQLNDLLGLAPVIGTATPSHGPHVLSGRALSLIDNIELAVPPLILSRAVQYQLSVGIAAHLPHIFLGSPYRGEHHNQLIADTIIGDCLESCCLWQNTPRRRCYQHVYYHGYNPSRRFDLLTAFQTGLDFC